MSNTLFGHFILIRITLFIEEDLQMSSSKDVMQEDKAHAPEGAKSAAKGIKCGDIIVSNHKAYCPI